MSCIAQVPRVEAQVLLDEAGDEEVAVVVTLAQVQFQCHAGTLAGLAQQFGLELGIEKRVGRALVDPQGRAAPAARGDQFGGVMLAPGLAVGAEVAGAIIGGLIIGVGEKLSEVFIGPMVGGGIEIWFAYMLALVFLLFRPQGLFGEKIIDRV